MKKRIFVHDTSILSSSGAVREPDDGYHGRGLCVSRPGDVVALDRTLRDEAAWLQQHYRRIGMPVADEVVWGVEQAQARDFPDHMLDPFIFDERPHAIRPDQ